MADREKTIRLAHSELTGTIYAIIGREKIDITEQAIAEVKAIKALEEKPKTDVLDKIRAEIEEKAEALDLTQVSDVALECAYIEVLKMIDKYRKEN